MDIYKSGSFIQLSGAGRLRSARLIIGHFPVDVNSRFGNFVSEFFTKIFWYFREKILKFKNNEK